MNPTLHHARQWLVPALVLLLTGCGSQPIQAPVHGRSAGHVEHGPRHSEPGSSAPLARRDLLDIALQLKGTPYRYGGNHPGTGFDCSGFIQFSHSRAGLRVPRTTRQQFQSSRSVSIQQIRPGDLLFYETEGRRPGHVALYLGQGRMIHAPSSGKAVTISRLDNPYWRSRLLAAGRF